MSLRFPRFTDDAQMFHMMHCVDVSTVLETFQVGNALTAQACAAPKLFAELR